MTPLERIEATATGYSQATEALRLEELILSAMSPSRVESRPHVIAQLGRVEALKRVVQILSDALLKPQEALSPDRLNAGEGTR